MAKELTVVSVTLIASIEDGEVMNQVAFGRYIKTTPEIMKRTPPGGGQLPKEIATTELLLQMKFDSLVPYQVGSKWKLDVNSTNGELKLTKV